MGIVCLPPGNGGNGQQFGAMEHDDAAIERIGAVIQSLRESGQLRDDETGVDGTPLRLYRTREGEFVRVLDDDTAPLTAKMLRAIERYTKRQSTAASVEKQAEETPVNEIASDGNSLSNDVVQGHVSLSDHRVSPTTAAAPVPTINGDFGAHAAQDDDVAMEEAVVSNDTPAQTVEEESTLTALVGEGLNVGAWLNGDDASSAPTEMDVGEEPMASSNGSSPTGNLGGAAVPIEPLLGQWPPKLLERTRVCHVVRDAPHSVGARHCVVYWVRNTFRVANGNFGLTAALELGRQLALPVVAVSLLPSSIMYPVRHASGINDALTRWSIAEMRQRLRDHHRIELFAYTPRELWKSAPHDAHGINSAMDGGSALHALFDAFSPAAVVTDDGFSVSSRAEVESLRQYLQTRVRASWSLLAVDSMTSVAFQSRSEAIRKSFDVDTAIFLNEEAFASEYASLTQQQEPFSLLDPQVSSQFQNVSVRALVSIKLQPTLKHIQLEEIMWEVVEAMNAQAGGSLAVSSERIALERLEALILATDERPAIQQELQGSGILSLLPFIRHGTLFSGFVLDHLTAASAAMPRPTDAKSRKAFAMSKVLRSRASMHLAKERDYALYVSLWATRQVERELQLSGRMIPFRALASFKTSLSELDTYTHVLPSWVSPNKHLSGGALRQTPAYDPYQLESGRTDDPYWNEIQLFLIETRYLHPLVMSYWAYRVLQWSVSSRAGVATIEALLDKCSLGSTLSPDAVFSVWISLFRLGKDPVKPISSSSSEETEGEFTQRLETDLSDQQRLQIRK